MSDNHWNLVQTATGKIVPRDKVKIVEEERWVCENPGHLGGFPAPGVCRICSQELVPKPLPVAFKEV